MPRNSTAKPKARPTNTPPPTAVLDDADPILIAERLAAFQDVDQWALQGFTEPALGDLFILAAATGEGDDVDWILGDSGDNLRLLSLYDADRFELVDVWEEDAINTTGNVRAPLVLQLYDRTTPAPTQPEAGPVANSGANLRAGPGTDYAVVGGVTAGQALNVVGRNPVGDWLRLADGRWIAAGGLDSGRKTSATSYIESGQRLQKPTWSVAVGSSHLQSL